MQKIDGVGGGMSVAITVCQLVKWSLLKRGLGAQSSRDMGVQRARIMEAIGMAVALAGESGWWDGSSGRQYGHR